MFQLEEASIMLSILFVWTLFNDMFGCYCVPSNNINNDVDSRCNAVSYKSLSLKPCDFQNIITYTKHDHHV